MLGWYFFVLPSPLISDFSVDKKKQQAGDIYADLVHPS